jgi:HlyD family secretion protein
VTHEITRTSISSVVTGPPVEPEAPASPSVGTAVIPMSADVPAVQEGVLVRDRRSRWRLLAILGLLIVAAAGGGLYWWHTHQQGLPVGIVLSNGRVEAEEIDVDTKFAGRVAQLLVDEGDSVTAGQAVARMDTRDLQASLEKAKATVQQAQHSVDEARSNVVQQQTQVTLAQQQFDRTNALVGRGYATYETLDQRRQALNGANAALAAANDRVGEADRALAAAARDVNLYEVNIADNTLVSPTQGRIQYRISNVGEVLPVGGKVFTLLDTSGVYMDIYLPTADAGRVRIGSEARIVLDAYPAFAVPAHVSFIATQAQFTPKAVETKSERDKLMFRVKVRVDADFLKVHVKEVRTGLPGIAYVLVDPKVTWPASLQGPVEP